ncbi:MAG: DUF4157 domain-containing protein [Anaerolineales bacterium]|nr:DUF4157 domain-containing protein [Anaerolineales bacterium]
MSAPDRRHHAEAAEAADHPRRAEEDDGPNAPSGLSPDQAALFGLNQAIGNQSVGRLLRRSGGSPLPEEARRAGEARLGRPVSDEVRVHTSPDAAASAQALGASAYTVGNDIVFGPQAYAPGTAAGDELLAHELAHVAQQEHTGTTADPTRLNPPGHPSEQQAQAAGRGRPTPLNAAPAGIARAAGDEPATPAAAPNAASATAPTAEPEITAEDLARDKAIDDSIEIADTRGRTLLNTDYNDVQDAARDFEASTSDGIDALDAEPSGYLGIASTVVGLVASSVSARYSNLTQVGVGSAVFSAMFSMGQTALTSYVTKAADTDPKAAAKAVMRGAAKAVGYAQAAFFTSLRGSLHAALVKQARRYPDAADLLERGSSDDIDTVLRDYIGVPNPDSDPLYGPVREAMEIAFEDWKTKQVRQEKYSWLDESMGLSDLAAEPGRSAARARVAGAVEARSGRPPVPLMSQAANSINAGLTNALSLAFAGALPPDPAQPVADVEATLDPVDDATEAAEQDHERAIQKGVALAETRAREYLNTHYNDVQDAVRDFLAVGEEKVDAFSGALSGHWGLVSAIFSGVMGVISSRFPSAAVGKIIGAAAATAAQAGLQTTITTDINAEREDTQDEAQAALHAFGAATANTQAGAFRLGREALKDQLLLLATTDEVARMLFETGDRDAIHAIITDQLYIPDPDEYPMYSDVRLEMEIPFSEWMTRQRQHAEGWDYLSQFDTNTDPARREVAAEAALRDAGRAADKPVWPDAYAEMDEERVGPEPPVEAPAGERSLAEETATEDRDVLKRITEVDTRARGYLNALADDVQDAVKDFVPRALGQTTALNTDVGDWAGYGNTLLGVAFSVLTIAFPPAGVGLAVAGAVTGLVAQGVSGYQTDYNASVQQNARIMINGTARSIQAGYVSAFRTARRALGPALISLGLLDDDAREALLIGGQDNYDYVIQDKLGIPKPESADLYLQTRRKLEEEFTTWLTAQLGRDQKAHETAIKEGQAAAAADDATRRGDQPAGSGPVSTAQDKA